MAGSDLVISIGASIKDLERQMKAASQIAAKRADEIENEFKKRNPQFGGKLMAFGLGAIGGAAATAAGSLDRIASAITAANKEIAGFAQTSRLAGIELQRFQELRYAAGSKGIGGKEFDQGIQGLAKELNEAGREETELGKFLDANNLKIRNRRGEIISTNEALSIAADLIGRASNEQDKIAIAEKFKLPADFVPLLENGAAALDKLAKNAAESGAVLSRDVIEKAEQFDRAWDSAWNSFFTKMKATIAETGVGLAGIIKQAGDMHRAMENARKAGSAMGTMMGEAMSPNAVTAPSPVARPADLGWPTDAPQPPARPRNLGAPNFPSSKKGGGGSSGGGKSDEEKRTDQVNSYIEALSRANRVLEAEAATLGKSKAERAAAIELARIGTVTDEAQRAKIEEIVGANEKLRTKILSVKEAQDQLRDAQRFFGDMAVDALSDIVLEGGKAEDVIKNLAKALAKAAMQAALMGTGPIGGVSGIPASAKPQKPQTASPERIAA